MRYTQNKCPKHSEYISPKTHLLDVLGLILKLTSVVNISHAIFIFSLFAGTGAVYSWVSPWFRNI